LVAARRQIKTAGLYRWIRHPLYASYLLSYVGYVLSNSSVGNIAIALLASFLLIARLQREERFLSRDSEYVLYMRRVKYRVLPLVF
jgi:protein-S-isoprenylcysteine O-methyltransferase Ste14